MKACITDDNKLMLIPESDIEEKFLFGLAHNEVQIDLFGHTNSDAIVIHATIASDAPKPKVAPPIPSKPQNLPG